MVNVKTKKTDSELKPSLLIVDDEPLVRKSLARILTNLANRFRKTGQKTAE